MTIACVKGRLASHYNKDAEADAVCHVEENGQLFSCGMEMSFLYQKA
ncbi:MAG: hypothetical protein HXK89_03130 [Lachnospiraceae bacterium]|nr:hypothetical protein [Lachnospiraceae bacterium]